MQHTSEVEMFRYHLMKYLETHDISATQFAKSTGLSMSIHHYINGNTPFPTRFIAKCSIAMNVTADWLLGITTGEQSGLTEDECRLIDVYNLATNEDKGRIDSILSKYTGHRAKSSRSLK